MRVPSQSKRTPSTGRFCLLAMDVQSSRNIPRSGLAEGEKTGRQTVVAIKLNVVEGRSDAKPAWHGSRLCAANARHRDQDDISQAQGFTDEDHFKFNRSSDDQGFRRKEVNAG